MKTVQPLSILIMLLLSPLIFGANIDVPALELISKGAMSGNDFVISTQGSMELLLQGGDKFGGEVIMGFLSRDMEEDLTTDLTDPIPDLDGLALLSANVTILNLFNSPLAFSYFVGGIDNFCSGDSFAEVFGAMPIITSYSGFIYFSDGVVYDGILPISGTGIKLALNPIKNRFAGALYFYQDNYLGDGKYSYDLRGLFNFTNINLEFFAGGSITGSDLGYYRAGILFNAITPTGGFLMQLGLPRWDPVNDDFGIQLFYMLFETNINLGVMSIIPSVFIHPGYYKQLITNESGIIDVNLNLQFGDIQETPASGGLEANISFENASINGLGLKISPYLELASPGVIWQLKVNTNVFPFPGLTNMFEGFIGIKAVF